MELPATSKLPPAPSVTGDVRGMTLLPVDATSVPLLTVVLPE